MGNIRSQMQLKVNLQRAVNNPTPMQQVKYPAKRNTVTWWQRRRDVCCQQTGEQTAPCLTALPVHLQAVSAHFIALHSCLGLCAPGCGRRAVRLHGRLLCRRRCNAASETCRKKPSGESGPESTLCALWSCWNCTTGTLPWLSSAVHCTGSTV